MKPGWKSSEFWVTLLAQAGATIYAVAGSLPPEYAAGVIVASQVAYALSRGLAKAKGKTIADAEALARKLLEKYGQPPVA